MWWFIARDDEAAHMPDEEEGERPSIVFDADESELAALGEALAVAYAPVLVLDVSGSGAIVRVPHAFLTRLAGITDVASVLEAWQAKSASIRGRDLSALTADLTQMSAFAAEALDGAGILALHET